MPGFSPRLYPGKMNLTTGIIGAFLVLASCVSGNNIRNGLPDDGRQNTISTNSRALSANPVGEVFGNGQVRVTLLVPATIPGGAAEIAKELRNGAAMAVEDFGQDRIQVVVKDTKGQASEAQARTAEALSEGSSLILGPLFAANVSAAAGITLPANVPMLAFSTDTSVARRGVYLFSYTPQSDTRRMLDYATVLGSRSISAFLPRNPEGALRKRILEEMTLKNGISLAIHEYERTPEGIGNILAEGVASVLESDTVYIPEGGPIPALMMTGLTQNGVDFSEKKILGSGAWEAIDVSDPVLEGAFFPGRDTSKFEGFSQRYEEKFGSRPGVQAALAYDAVNLASELVRQNGPSNAFRKLNFESNRGFQGITGAFRIRFDGTTDRGLAIYRIENRESRLIEPAISTFSGFAL